MHFETLTGLNHCFVSSKQKKKKEKKKEKERKKKSRGGVREGDHLMSTSGSMVKQLMAYPGNGTTVEKYQLNVIKVDES